MTATRPPRARYDVVAIATSAGGLDALRAVLSALPVHFPAAVLVMQHLGRDRRTLVEILAAHSALPVAWVTDGAVLTPGRVFVCPPQRRVEVRANHTCAVLDGVCRAPDGPINTLFRSLADAVGSGAIGVVLTGMGRDGADGADALHRAGATVLAQSAASARYPSMPEAAAATGAVDVLLPLDEIGSVLAQIVARGERPRSRGAVVAGATPITPGEPDLGDSSLGSVLVQLYHNTLREPDPSWNRGQPP